MPATVKRPRVGRQAGRFTGRDPGFLPGNPSIAGAPPASVIEGDAWNAKRQGSEKLHPLGFARRQAAQQAPAPSSPFYYSTSKANAEVQQLDVGPETKRMLATLPADEQNRLVRGAVTAGLPQTDETYMRLIEGTLTAALTPGEPEANQAEGVAADQVAEIPSPPEFIIPTFIAELSATVDGGMFGSEGPPTSDELEEARARIIGGGGPDAPEPEPEDVLEEVLSAREED